MKKKFLVIILIIVVIIFGIISYEFFNSQNSIEIDGVEFILPDGYYKSNGLNKVGDLIITNGSNSIFFADYGNEDLNKSLYNYVNEREMLNESVVISNIEVNDILVYKTTNLNSSSNHYWFIKDSKLYSIYTWDENPDMDKIVLDLVYSIK